MIKNDSAYRLLIECCSQQTDIDKLNTYINKVEDWQRFYELSGLHGVAPLVYQALKHQQVNIPKDILSDFKIAYINICQINMQMSAQLIKIFQLFEKNNIEALAFKGPTLSQLIYGDITSRQYSDLDILIDETIVSNTAKLMMDNGFEMDFSHKFLKNQAYLDAGKDIHLTQKEQNILVELHWKLFERKFMFKRDDFFNQHQSVMINNQEFKTLKNENMLLYLCIHGSKHFWERLEWIVDIDRLIRKYNDIDFEMLQQQADNIEVNRMFYLGLLVSYTLFNTPLPQNIHDKIVEHPELVPIKDKIISLLVHDTIGVVNEMPVDLESIATMALLTDNKKANKKSRLNSYFRIKEGDVLLINLPSYLSFLYYFIRPFRIISKYLKK